MATIPFSFLQLETTTELSERRVSAAANCKLQIANCKKSARDGVKRGARGKKSVEIYAKNAKNALFFDTPLRSGAKKCYNMHSFDHSERVKQR